MSMPPRPLTVSATMRSTGSMVERLASIERKRRPSFFTAALGFDRRHKTGARNVAPASASASRHALAQARIGSGDERDFAGKTEGVAHDRLYFSWQMSRTFMSVVVEILAAHRPDEGVVRRARTHMDRPGWRHDPSSLARTIWRMASGSPMKWKTRSSGLRPK